MHILELIQAKRDGGELTQEEIEFILKGHLSGEIPDHQIAALLMAVFFKGMSDPELADWTATTIGLGHKFDASDVTGPKIDMQSTGGVGDKTGIIVGSLASAAGISVPMTATHGLLHTGGTLDRLSAIPGFNTNIDDATRKSILKGNGWSVVGENEKINPLVTKLAALRSATGTVESVPLVAGSILALKLSEGVDSILFDVKTGSGAIVKKMTDARRLAQTLINVCKRMDKKALCVISDMDQPLGNAIGSALEVMEAIEAMRGNGPADLVELSLEISARMICMAHPDRTLESAKEQVFTLLSDGSALNKFRSLIQAQGGNPQVIDSFELLPNASADFVISSPRAGYVSRISADEIGQAVNLLSINDKKEVDRAVGIVLEHKTGDKVQAGERLCSIYYNSDANLEEACQMVEDAFHISSTAPEPRPLVYEVLR